MLRTILGHLHVLAHLNVTATQKGVYSYVAILQVRKQRLGERWPEATGCQTRQWCYPPNYKDLPQGTMAWGLAYSLVSGRTAPPSPPTGVRMP